jgi:capsid protein
LLDADGTPVVRAGYDAVDHTNRRRAPEILLQSEDRTLLPERRRAMVATARDIRRNYSVAAWALRKHLDFVSTFKFHARTGNPIADGAVEEFIKWWSRPENFDVARRHGRDRFVRLVEGHALVDGDILVHKIADGRVQGIEGDRIRTPLGGLPPELANLPPEFMDGEPWPGSVRLVHGVQVDDAGRAIRYCVCKRFGLSGFVFERLLPAAWCEHHGYFERLDQVRGVTPLSTALNDLRDLYEAKDYALAKLKISQLFGLIFFRKSAEEMGMVSEVSPETADADDEASASPRYQVDPGKGPFKLELDPGDDAKWLETGTPATESQEFMAFMIEAALKSVDMPMSFYDGRRTNFFGSRGELNHYLFGAKIKRQNLVALLDNLVSWRLPMAMDDGMLTLPNGMKLRDLRWAWVPQGLPWWNPVQEATSATIEIAAAINSRQRVCMERGDDFDEITDELAYEKARLKSKGLPTDVKPPNVSISEDRTGDPQGGKN